MSSAYPLESIVCFLSAAPILHCLRLAFLAALLLNL
ncbi:MAG: hypothetical protein GX901_03485 [Lentisphaerae bacterium]|nr:hypothetical protein [Lentisphaerota bacterium]